MHVQDPSIPDPPSGDLDPRGNVSEEWFLHSTEMNIFVRFRGIAGMEIGGYPVIRVQWRSMPGSMTEWRDWDTDHPDAYCPAFVARKLYHHIAMNNYTAFTRNVV
tara:strand:+ start:630 stop:944 length:315 start_codon:yes stop_codon:yes gene_type:complete